MVKFKLQNKLVYTILSVLTVVVIAIGINAYGGSSPSVLGHTFGELTPPTGCSTTTNQVVQWTGTAWACVTPNLGDITDVVAGTGLSGGASSGAATVNVGAGTGVTVVADSIGLTNPVKTCPVGQAIRSFDLASGLTPSCVDVASGGTGDITSVDPGLGILGGGTSGPVTISADTNYLQRRISTGCPAGQFIVSISSTGVPTCAAPNSWKSQGWVSITNAQANDPARDPSTSCTNAGMVPCGDSQGYLCEQSGGAKSNQIFWGQYANKWTCTSSSISSLPPIINIHCCQP